MERIMFCVQQRKKNHSVTITSSNSNNLMAGFANVCPTLQLAVKSAVPSWNIAYCIETRLRAIVVSFLTQII